MITIFNLIGGFGGGPETNIYPQNAPTFSAPDGELIGVLKKFTTKHQVMIPTGH